MDTTIYRLNWQYDCWSDIENIFPKGSEVTAVVTKVTRDYAFLTTPEGVTCFLDKRKVQSPWFINDLAEEIKQGETVDCTMIDYNLDKKRLIVSLKLN